MTRLRSLIKEVLSTPPKKKDCNCGCGGCDKKAPIITESRIKKAISEGLTYHVENKIPLHESVYRIGSEKHFELINEARKLWVRGLIDVSEDDQAILETHLGHFGMYEGEKVPLDMPMVNEETVDWPKVVSSRYGEYKFVLDKVMSDRAKYKVVDVETGKEEPGGRVYGTPSQLQAAADDLIKPSGGRQSSQFEESLNEGKYYITRNLGRGQGMSLVKDKEFKSYEDAKEEADKLERNSRNMTAYFVSDKDMNRIEESLNESYMGNKGDEVMITNTKKPDGDIPGNWVLEKPDGSAMVDMFFDSKEAAKKYAKGKGLKLVPGFKEDIKDLNEENKLSSNTRSLIKLVKSAKNPRNLPISFGTTSVAIGGTQYDKGELVDMFNGRELGMDSIDIRKVFYNAQQDAEAIADEVNASNSGIEATIGYGYGKRPILYLKKSSLEEAKKKKKKKKKDPPLNKPKRGGSKAYYVYVRDPKTKKIVKVSFGSGGLRAKIKDKEKRNAFAARHNCKNKKDRTSPGYWSCNLPRYAEQLGLGSNMNTFW